MKTFMAVLVLLVASHALAQTPIDVNTNSAGFNQLAGEVAKDIASNAASAQNAVPWYLFIFSHWALIAAIGAALGSALVHAYQIVVSGGGWRRMVFSFEWGADAPMPVPPPPVKLDLPLTIDKPPVLEQPKPGEIPAIKVG